MLCLRGLPENAENLIRRFVTHRFRIINLETPKPGICFHTREIDVEAAPKMMRPPFILGSAGAMQHEGEYHLVARRGRLIIRQNRIGCARRWAYFRSIFHLAPVRQYT